MPAVVTTIRVRYAETDQMGVAHHGAYVAWLEEARIEWLRAMGISYRDLEKQGVLMPVVELSVAYKRPFRFDDEVELTTDGEAIGPSRVRFRSQLRLLGADTVHAEASVTVASTSPEGRPVRVPPALCIPPRQAEP